MTSNDRFGKDEQLRIFLAAIPAECQHQLAEKVQERAHLATIARSLTDWVTVAPYLSGVEEGDVEAIKHDHHGHLDQQKLRLLEVWKERNGPFATYQQLGRSLVVAGRISAMETLCRVLGATDFPQEPRVLFEDNTLFQQQPGCGEDERKEDLDCQQGISPGSRGRVDSSEDYPDDVLELGLEHVLDIHSHLMDLNKQELKTLGLILGLSSRTVNDHYEGTTVSAYRDSIVTAWLRQQDRVGQKGRPSWWGLVAALEGRQLRLMGPAAEIRREKLSQYNTS